jgi:hypothetical protein
MIKINGRQFIERDYVGEIGRVGNKRLIRSACNAFWRRRGLSPDPSYREVHGRFASSGKRNKQKS